MSAGTSQDEQNEVGGPGVRTRSVSVRHGRNPRCARRRLRPPTAPPILQHSFPGWHHESFLAPEPTNRQCEKGRRGSNEADNDDDDGRTRVLY